MKQHQNIPKPMKRHRFRLLLGGIYFTFKRHLMWKFGGNNFSRLGRVLPSELYAHFSHQTPLLRKLKDVDMQLQYNKITNLKLACAKIDGITIHPGEVFSYWKLIGKPTARKGYLPGMVLHSGTVKAGIGGGLCQLSNLLYWMVLHTPLTVTERHRHSYDVFPDSDRTQPFGSGATCFYNYGDLMFKNDTKEIFQIRLEITESHLKGIIKASTPPALKYEIYEKAHIIKSTYWGGYTRHNVLFRKMIDLNDVVVVEEFVAENMRL